MEREKNTECEEGGDTNNPTEGQISTEHTNRIVVAKKADEDNSESILSF